MSALPLRRWLVGALLCALAALVLLAPGRAEAPKGSKHALLVGVRDYDHDKLPNLRFTENDVEELARVLSSGGFSSIRVLNTSRGVKGKTDAPTAANIRAALKDLLARKKKQDTILVALAGHGIHASVKGKEESFFCPADAQLNDTSTLINLGTLFDDLGDCGAAVKLLLVDACRNDPKTGRNVDIDTLPRLPRGTAALFSCSSGERAFESPKLGRGHGVFFYHVLEGLKGEAKNRDGEVTWSRLTEHVTRSVSRQVPVLIGDGAQQTPELKVNLRGESPVLIRPDSAAVVVEKEITNSIGMTLVRIPAGTFRMGSTKDEQDEAIADYEKFSGKKAPENILALFRREGPQHAVQITRPFYLGMHEVTQAQYEKVMDRNPSYFSASGGGKDKVAGMSTGNFPVEQVSWKDAVEFCEKLSKRAAEKRAGRKYRLPTEAEWGYSCRGGATTSTYFHFGNSLSSRQANFDGNYPFGGAEKGDYQERTCKAGSYKPNRFGLHDMHGNVWEWCADWFDKDYYSSSPRKDPSGPTTGTSRVLRGGSWGSHARNCRSAFRCGEDPDYRGHYCGFRVACSAGGR
jgi:formylglycine-generating enzyme required for sulfatase activity